MDSDTVAQSAPLRPAASTASTMIRSNIKARLAARVAELANTATEPGAEEKQSLQASALAKMEMLPHPNPSDRGRARQEVRGGGRGIKRQCDVSSSAGPSPAKLRRGSKGRGKGGAAVKDEDSEECEHAKSAAALPSRELQRMIPRALFLWVGKPSNHCRP